MLHCAIPLKESMPAVFHSLTFLFMFAVIEKNVLDYIREGCNLYIIPEHCHEVKIAFMIVNPRIVCYILQGKIEYYLQKLFPG